MSCVADEAVGSGVVRVSTGTARGAGVLRRRAPDHLRGHGTQAPRHGATERPVLVHGVSVSHQHSGRQGEGSRSAD